jgi:hypothetical protein
MGGVDKNINAAYGSLMDFHKRHLGLYLFSDKKVTSPSPLGERVSAGRVRGDRHTLRLYQPPWATDRSKDDDVRLVRESLCEHLANDTIVSYITEIDGHLAHVIPSTFSLGKKNLDILKHTLRLTDDITYVNNHTLVVDTCRTTYEDVSSVLIIHVCATLEAHAIVACAVEVGWCIEILNLIFADTINGIVIQLHEDVRISLTTTYASRGYEMSLVG